MIESVKTLNELYSSLSARRRYEVWFIRVGLADGSGAWWFRYLLMNPGRGGCLGNSRGMPLQVWATWFPHEGEPQSYIQGFPSQGLNLSARGRNPFRLRIGDNEIEENSCCGKLEVDGHAISWELQFHSRFRFTLSNKGWIGFSRTPHSDAVFSGHIALDGRRFDGNPLGFGVQGHNCGYRHRDFWTWTHAFFPTSGISSGAMRATASASTFEALIYEMPFGLVFRKAMLWHEGEAHAFRSLQESRRDADGLSWNFGCSTKHGLRLEAAIDGAGPGIHRLPYLRTDCKSNFEVANNSLSHAVLRLERPGRPLETLETNTGAVLEMVGRQKRVPTQSPRFP